MADELEKLRALERAAQARLLWQKNHVVEISEQLAEIENIALSARFGVRRKSIKKILNVIRN